MKYKIIDETRSEWVTLPDVNLAMEHVKVLEHLHPQHKFKIEFTMKE